MDAVITFVSSNAVVILTAIVIALYYYLNTIRLDYWEKQGVKGPKPLPFIGNSWEQFFKPIYTINKERCAKYGRIFGFYEMSQPVLNVAEPELIRHILVKDSDVFINRRPSPSPSPYLSKFMPLLNDGKWKRMRALMSPTFTSGKLKRMTVIVDRCIQDLIQNITEIAETGKEINLRQLYGAYTMDVIALCAFATKTNAHNCPDDPFVKNAKLFARFNVWRLLVLMLLPKPILRIIDFNAQPSSVVKFFEVTVKQIIKQRHASGIKVDDFLQLLLDAEKSDDLASEVVDINSEQLSSESQEDITRNVKLLSSISGDTKLDEEEIISQSLLFFIAGYETTAALLSYASYALAVNPEKQETLFKEVKHYFDTDEAFTYETVNKMKYLNAVLSETLRMYPPAVRLERTASKEYRLPNSHIVVPKGALVQVPIAEVHHDENNFPEPEAFKPERFMPENVENIKPYTYLPFGSGPRNCIGMRFSLMEAKLALCNVILHHRFVKSENTDVPLKLVHIASSLLPTDKIIVKIEKR